MIQKLHDIILKNMDRYTQLSDTIWDYAEIEFDTPKSSQVLIDTLLEHGFKIEKGPIKLNMLLWLNMKMVVRELGSWVNLMPYPT